MKLFEKMRIFTIRIITAKIGKWNRITIILLLTYSALYPAQSCRDRTAGPFA